VDDFAEAFGGFDPPGDPDGALKFGVLMGDRLDELSSILTDGNEIGALGGRSSSATVGPRAKGPAVGAGHRGPCSAPMSIPTSFAWGIPKLS
jgi:hypothetical protein